MSLVKHVAIIMDGNGRWAKERDKARVFGHRAGVKAVRRVVEHSARLGIESLTLYAFSSENWRRPQAEIKLLFELLLVTLSEQISELHENNIKLSIIGDQAALPKRLVKKIAKSCELTQNNSGMILNIALNYGARWEIANAAKQLALACDKGELKPDQIDEAAIEEKLSTHGQAELDLLIRTGGERRLSNFLLWQAAYAELYFSEVFWPDFDEQEFDRALAWFAARNRRFGKTDEQVKVSK